MKTIPVIKSKGFGILSGIFLLFLFLAVYSEMYYLSSIPFLLLFIFYGWQHFYFVFLLLLVSIPWSAEYNFSKTLATDFPDELLMLFVSYLFFACYLYKQDPKWKTFLRHPLLGIFVIHLLWISICVCFSSSGIISVKFLLAKSWYAVAFVFAPLILLNDKKTFQSAIRIITISLLLVVFIIMSRHAFTGFTFATINDAVFPFFRNHVNYAAMLVCFIPVLLACYGLAPSGKKKYFISCLVSFLVVALFFSFSRGAWLALPVGLIAYWLIRKKLLIAGYITAIIITIASLFWVKSNDRYLNYAHDYKTTIFHKDFREHFIATYKLKDVSTAERFYRWVAGVRMIKDHWLLGYGPGTFYQNYKPYAIPAYRTWVSDNKDHSTVHNYFLLLAVEQGIPGVVFFLVLIGAMLYYAQMLYHRIRDEFYKTVAITAGVIIAMLVVVNFLSDLVETDKAGSVFFLCLSFLIIADTSTRKLLSEPAPDIQGIS